MPQVLKLQRGRAQLSAESRAEKARLPETIIASTGPRSIERGVRLDALVPGANHLASTGPRSIERGVQVQIYLLRPLQVASTGPRSIERGVGVGLGDCALGWTLQRGRAQLSAESSTSSMDNKPDTEASTGPRSIERGVYLVRNMDAPL